MVKAWACAQVCVCVCVCVCEREREREREKERHYVHDVYMSYDILNACTDTQLCVCV